MFTSDEIFARLMNGESMDAIAAEMTEALNAAKAKKDEEDKKKVEAEAKAKREAVINEAAEKAAAAVNELIRIMYPEMVEDTENLTGAMMKDMVNSSYSLVKEVEKALPLFEKAVVASAEKELMPKVGGITKTSAAGKRSKVSVDEICDADVEKILNAFMKSL